MTKLVSKPQLRPLMRRPFWEVLSEVTDGNYPMGLSTLWARIRPIIEIMPAAVSYHHRWVGGLHDHIVQVAVLTWEATELHGIRCKPWEPFAMSLFHDWDKLYKYRPRMPHECSYKSGANGPRHKWDPKSPVPDIEVLEDYCSDIDGVKMPFTIIEKHARLNSDSEAQELRIGMTMGRHRVPLSNALANAITMCEGGFAQMARSNPRSNIGNFASAAHYGDMVSAKVYAERGGWCMQNNKDMDWETLWSKWHEGMVMFKREVWE